MGALLSGKEEDYERLHGCWSVGGQASVFPEDTWDDGISWRQGCMSKDVPNLPPPLPTHSASSSAPHLHEQDSTISKGCASDTESSLSPPPAHPLTHADSTSHASLK